MPRQVLGATSLASTTDARLAHLEKALPLAQEGHVKESWASLEDVLKEVATKTTLVLCKGGCKTAYKLGKLGKKKFLKCKQCCNKKFDNGDTCNLSSFPL